MFEEFLLLFFFLLNLLIYFFREKIIKVYNVYDYPDKDRKIHKYKTSLLGGFIFFCNLSFFSIILLFLDGILIDRIVFFKNIENYFLFYFISLCFYFLGFYDDKKNLNANLKLLIITFLITIIIYLDKDIKVQIINFSFNDRYIALGNFDFLFTLFCFIAFINAFNLYDGINLQNGIYTLLILIFLSIKTNNNIFIILFFCPLLIFLILNSSGKIFLGNSGTYFMSFVISYLFIKSFNLYGNFYSDQILAIMLIPGLDMIRIFFFRIRLKKHPFTPDRNHIHHKFLEKFGYKKTIFIISIISVIPIVLITLYDNYVSLLISVLLYFITILFLKKLSKSF